MRRVFGADRDQQRRTFMHAPLKIVGYVVVLAMASTAVYVAYIAVTYWSGISV